LVGKSKKQHQKQKPSEGKNRRHRGSHAIRVPKKELDTADFLIDGLTSGRTSGAWSYAEDTLHLLREESAT